MTILAWSYFVTALCLWITFASTHNTKLEETRQEVQQSILVILWLETSQISYMTCILRNELDSLSLLKIVAHTDIQIGWIMAQDATPKEMPHK